MRSNLDRPADRGDVRRPCAGEHALVRAPADHRDRLDPAQGQQVAVVLQQDERVFRGLLRDKRVRRIVDRRDLHRIVDRSLGEERPQDARHHVVEPRLRDRARLQGRLHRGRREPRLVRHAAEAGELVEPVIGGADRRMDRAPVAHHEALIAPVALQDRVEQIIVLAAPAAVDEVVGAHHRARGALLDRQLEREQVGLAHCSRRNGDVERGPQRLLVVHRIMLDRRDDAVRLNAVDQRAGHGAREQRVLADIFEIAAVARFARQVDAARQHGVMAGGASLGADHPAARSRNFGVEARGRCERGRQGGARNEAVAHPHRRIGLGLVGDAETRDPGDEPGRALDEVRDYVIFQLGGDHVVRNLGDVGKGLVGKAEHEPELLIQGHCREGRLRPGLGGQFGITPWLIGAAWGRSLDWCLARR